MKHRDTLVASAVLALSMLAMAGMVGSGAYAHAASAEARGVDALSTIVSRAMRGDTRPATVVAAAPGAAR